ncbi:MAG: hypothetical protein K0R50_1953 [Eubacterium sp.]|jgi:hypothetical protein|nr:hypothetical protein [Eubacterium sp.]
MNLDNPYSKISNTLKKVRRRILLKITLRNVAAGLCAALATGIVMGLLSRVIPIYKVYAIWGYVSAAVLVLALLSVFFFLPKKMAVAQLLDSFGLQERLITSLELEKEDSEFKELLLNDTVYKLNSLDYKAKIKLSPDKKNLTALFILLLAFGISAVLPQPLLEEAQQAHELSVHKKEQKKKVEKAEKEVKENSALTEVQKKDLLAKLDALKLELKKAQDLKEADKALEKLSKKLEQKIDRTNDTDLKEMAEKLAENKHTKALADALKTEKAEEFKKELENLKNKAKSMSAADKKSLEDALAKAAGSVGDSDLKDGLESLGNALSNGNENAINKSVDKLSGAVSSSLDKKNMNDALAQAQNNLQPNTATAQNQGQGQGNGSGQGQGSGQGSGQSQGAGAGKGAGGSGAGSGSGNGDGGVTPYGQGGIANKPPSAGTEKEYEKVFTPSRLGGQGETSLITGKGNNNGKGETTITNNTDATLGELKPYNQVVGEYSEKAMESMDNSSIPGGMEDIIKDYFSSLQD